MTTKEKENLIEYRYRKSERLENQTIESYNNIQRFKGYENNYLVNEHFNNIVKREFFKSIMNDVFEILNINQTR